MAGLFASFAIPPRQRTSPSRRSGGFTAHEDDSIQAASFGAWARCIATNLAIDHLRHTRSEVELPDDQAQPASGDPVVRRETRRQIAVAFRCLPLKLRVPATLSLIEEQSPKEIAEALGTSEGAVRVRVFRAVRLLRQQLRRVGVKR